MSETGAELLSRWSTLHNRGDVAAGIGLLEAGYRRLLREDQPVRAAAVARTRAYQCVLDGQFELASGWLGRARRLAADHKDPVELAWLELFDAMADDDMDRGTRRLGHVRLRARDLGADDLECDVNALLGNRHVLHGDIAQGMALLDEALTAVCAGEVDNAVVVEGACCLLLWSCEVTQDVDRAEQWLARLDPLIAGREQVSLRPVCQSYYGGILAAAGRWEEAEQTLDDAIQRLDRGYAFARRNALVRLADLRQRQGQYEAATQLLSGLEEHVDAAVPLTRIHLATGHVALAEERLARALPQATGIHRLHLLVLEVDLALTTNAAERADDAVAELRAAGEGTRGDSAYLVGLGALASGRVSAVQGEDAAAATALRRAVASFAAARTPFELAIARLDLAALLVDHAAEVSAVEARRALRTGQQLGAARLVDRAADILRMLGHPVRVGQRGQTRLTGREQEVLTLLGAGLTNPEIADRLVISRKTVEHHVSRILLKLGLRNRTEAAAHELRTRASAAE